MSGASPSFAASRRASRRRRPTRGSRTSSPHSPWTTTSTRCASRACMICTPREDADKNSLLVTVRRSTAVLAHNACLTRPPLLRLFKLGEFVCSSALLAAPRGDERTCGEGDCRIFSPCLLTFSSPPLFRQILRDNEICSISVSSAERTHTHVASAFLTVKKQDPFFRRKLFSALNSVFSCSGSRSRRFRHPHPEMEA